MNNITKGLLTILAAILLISTISCTPVLATAPPTSEPTATALPPPSPAPTIQPEDSTRELEVNGSKRTYQLYIPPGLARDQAVPVVFFFHGLYSVSITRSTTDFDETANANRFIVVYPVGVGSSWNAGGCCGMAAEDQVDEAALVRQILLDLETIATIDPRRIYATGFYNGAMLTYRLACEMSDIFAAIASVSGPLFLNNCQPRQPVSVLHIHGLSDPYVPYEGGASLEASLPSLPPAEQGIDTWAQLNQCVGSPRSIVEGAITHTSYSCEAGTAIELYTIEGLEGWPQPAGAGERNFATNETIWEFFAAHPKP